MWRILTVVLLLFATPVAAQTAMKPAELDWLFGDWTGEGQMFGQPSAATLTVGPATVRGWVKIDYSVRVTNVAATTAAAFMGQGLYRAIGTGKWAGRWTDSNGSSHPLEGRVSGQKLVSTWGSVDTEIGRTSYQQSADGSLEVTDQVLQADGTWRLFARAVYRRATPR